MDALSQVEVMAIALPQGHCAGQDAALALPALQQAKKTSPLGHAAKHASSAHMRGR
jgi:hypothetical protein